MRDSPRGLLQYPVWPHGVAPTLAREPDLQKQIRVVGARQHNLRDISVDIPRDQLVVLTGLSGSGKSSLAFDTIYAEGQRKYVESLSVHARVFLEQIGKPDVDRIEGLPPTLAIEQRIGAVNPRSTVATTTEIYDFLRVLFARLGQPHCPKCGEAIRPRTIDEIVDQVMAYPDSARVMVMAPLARGRVADPQAILRRIQREGFVRARVNGELVEVETLGDAASRKKLDIDVVVDRLVVNGDMRRRLADAVELSMTLGEGQVIISRGSGAENGKWIDETFSDRHVCITCGVGLSELSPRAFSFNSPYGACESCGGLGATLRFDADLIVPDDGLSLEAGAIAPWANAKHKLGATHRNALRDICAAFEAKLDTPWRDLPPDARRIVLHGAQTPEDKAGGLDFEGVLPNLRRRYRAVSGDGARGRFGAYQSEHVCEACDGARLKPEALAVRIAGHNINALCRLPVHRAVSFFDDLRFEGESSAIAEPILSEVRRRVRFMDQVGLGYLSLDRASATLSGGEAQRIRLATQLGSGLVGVCYVLDEPTIGLHQRDNERLIAAIRRLVDLGNTVLVVEHDEDVIRAADYLIDMGPGAGIRGGAIIAEGPADVALANENSLTGRYLRGEYVIHIPEKRRPLRRAELLEVRGARENNLKDIDVRFPLGLFCAVTGVSGSGKSTLVNRTLLPALRRRLYRSNERIGAHDRLVGANKVDKVIAIDQAPIGRTPRSNPATYTGVFDEVRRLYARTKEARIRGYNASRFSFNAKGGRCEACQGQGTRRIEMHFLPDVFVECDACRGTRYNRETLEVRYRGKSIADILAMRIEESLRFFDSFPKIKQGLQALSDVGLGYVRLGQPSNQLSGGEAQRVKLAAELCKPATGQTLYVLDEPTTGLHFADIDTLLSVLNRLVDMGNSVIVIEHNLDVIKTADWVIDLGPEGGEAGGQVVIEGTPEDVAASAASLTGRYLRQKLNAADGETALSA